MLFDQYIFFILQLGPGSNELRYTNKPVMSYAACDASQAGILPGMLCAGEPPYYRDACQVMAWYVIYSWIPFKYVKLTVDIKENIPIKYFKVTLVVL